MSADDILAGLGLVIVLAVGCELLADRTRVPAIVLLLPAGFVAGIATDDVHPDALFGAAFQPLVSLGVGLILFEAGLRLRRPELVGGVRRVIVRLIPAGTIVTAVGVTLAVKLIFGLSWGARRCCCHCWPSCAPPTGCGRCSSGRACSSIRSAPCSG